MLALFVCRRHAGLSRLRPTQPGVEQVWKRILRSERQRAINRLFRLFVPSLLNPDDAKRRMRRGQIRIQPNSIKEKSFRLLNASTMQHQVPEIKADFRLAQFALAPFLYKTLNPVEVELKPIV